MSWTPKRGEDAMFVSILPGKEPERVRIKSDVYTYDGRQCVTALPAKKNSKQGIYAVSSLKPCDWTNRRKCKMLTHLSLFSGIGSLDLAAERAGFTTVGQCEWADYPTKVLEKHWPDVPRWRDIRTLTGDDFYARTGLRTVDVISGGFPCQPFSVAGKQKGKGDDRYLWPEMCRVIAELAPRCVVGENVPGILRIAAADVVSDMERLGYQTVVFDFEAAAVAAPHYRERVAFVGYREPLDMENSCGGRCIKQTVLPEQQRGGKFERTGETVAYSTMRRQQRKKLERSETWRFSGLCGWPAEPAVGRVAHGVPNRVDRIKCLGNAVVPAQFFPIFRALNVILTEEGMQCTQ